MGKRFLFVISLGLAVIAWSCGSGATDDAYQEDTEDSNTSWLTRNEVPANDFKPAQIEQVINDLVAQLNLHAHVNTMKLSYVPKDLTGFFETTVEGANDAFGELGVINTVVAPNVGMDAELARAKQIEYVREHVAGGYDGIGLASIHVDLVEEINAAVDAGITVVMFDSDEPTSKRQLYVGTINEEAGKTAGQTMVDLIGDTVGTVVILGNDDPTWTDGYSRTHEARKVLEAAGHTVLIQHINWDDSEENEAGMLELLSSANPPPVGCLGVFANSFQCATAAEAAGVIDDITVVAFDFEVQTLELMEEGKIQATHVQRQYYMGYVIPYLLYSINVLGLDATKSIFSKIMVDDERIDTGWDVIFVRSIEDYNAFLDSLGI